MEEVRVCLLFLSESPQDSASVNTEGYVQRERLNGKPFLDNIRRTLVAAVALRMFSMK